MHTNPGKVPRRPRPVYPGFPGGAGGSGLNRGAGGHQLREAAATAGGGPHRQKAQCDGQASLRLQIVEGIFLRSYFALSSAVSDAFFALRSSSVCRMAPSSSCRTRSAARRTARNKFISRMASKGSRISAPNISGFDSSPMRTPSPAEASRDFSIDAKHPWERRKRTRFLFPGVLVIQPSARMAQMLRI